MTFENWFRKQLAICGAKDSHDFEYIASKRAWEASQKETAKRCLEILNFNTDIDSAEVRAIKKEFLDE